MPVATEVRIGLIGAGFIGRVHGLAVQAVNRVFDEGPTAVAAVLVDTNERLAEQQAASLGFAKWTSDWEAALDGVDAVIIAVPSHMHRDIALAAISRGKHVLCEKPVGRSAADAEIVANAARSAGVTVGVGFTYLRLPLVQHAAAMVGAGSLGPPVSFRGWHAEDYLADPDAPFTWRLDASLAGRCGALGDLGWHIISIARRLCGPIESMNGLITTRYNSRRTLDSIDTRRKVENEDWASALVRFATGAVGTIEASRIAHGRKMDLSFELVCERGSIAFHAERSNELKIYRGSDPIGEQGFKTIHIDPRHPDYGAFLPAPAHGLGFNDLKTIELHHFLRAVANGKNLDPDLDEACRIARVCEALLASSASGNRVIGPEHAPAMATAART
jgi:predicted dehydrogenase